MKAKDRWLARFFHLFLTTCVLVLVFIKDTELKLYLYNGQLNYVFAYMSLVLLSTMFYLIASFMDPGYARSNICDVESSSHGVTFNNTPQQDGGGGENELLEANEMVDTSETSFMLTPPASKDSVSGTALPRWRRCGFCDIIQPLRAKHCEECQQCIRRYDHHCPWLGSCIGERNHKFFLAFLFSETCLIAWTIHISYRAFRAEHTWKHWFERNWMVLVLTMFLCAVMIVVGLLWLCHSFMMFTAQTTWEFMSRPRISYLKKLPIDYNPFDQGYLKNFLTFLCYFKVQRWDALYPD